MKVAIAGYGLEGESNYRYWQARGDDVTIVDEAEVPAKPIPEGATTILGERVFRTLHDFDLVVRTASLPPHFIVTDGRIWSSTNEFFKRCPAPIIGVTGTKGKGTTSSLITSILRAAGHTVHLVGNIGQPPLDVLPRITADDIVVFELSSFQLWDLERSPHVAVVLMIEPDHLDVHADFKDYIRAKSNIRRNQTANDVCFYHPSNKWSEQIAKSSVLGDRTRYNARDADGVYVEGDDFCVEGETICKLRELSLPGAHNVENACAAISAARVFTLDKQAIAKGLRVFEGLPHRLKFVREVDGVKYYDDSIATTPGSARAALQSFDEPKIIILGGSKKGSEYDDIVRECKQRDTKVVAIGETGKPIAEMCRNSGVEVIEPAGGMSEIVSACQSIADPGSVVILSPASASFDMFKNYSDRGDQFVAAVNRLAA
ncbi:MAG: UDP-N-acetylmuramoyl-L-alanine--D-glutamate ligase [Candidatus Saccharimonadales bacterium]